MPGGKTLVLRFECDGERIVGIRLSGDFFFHPEEGLESLERFLLEKAVWKEADAESVVSRYMERNGYRPVGFGPADLAYLLRGLRC